MLLTVKEFIMTRRLFAFLDDDIKHPPDKPTGGTKDSINDLTKQMQYKLDDEIREPPSKPGT